MYCKNPYINQISNQRLAYYRGAMGILLVFDVTDKNSFSNIRNWIRNIESHASEDVKKVLIGNKADMSANRVCAPSSSMDQWLTWLFRSSTLRKRKPSRTNTKLSTLRQVPRLVRTYRKHLKLSPLKFWPSSRAQRKRTRTLTRAKLNWAWEASRASRRRAAVSSVNSIANRNKSYHRQ